MTFVINKKKHQVLQLGTVMTKETYRDQGLSRRLIEEILKDYQGKVDMIFLFANETVLEFYPKFGFSRVMEDSYLLNVSDNKGQLDQWQLVNFSDNHVTYLRCVRDI
ncbi:GNAT family N-acetyltransferase [Vagococcus jeotgali]|uniref:GNAT family N-acetyltransferase n=1 Tax=Vagococcus jeotgali TaxID=3109030 RepID=UPI002DDA1CB7|nr:GNAT family N-acetyltransferase [Vagococcus sp. B2T-5]